VTLPLVVVLALLFGNAGHDKPAPKSTAPVALPALTPSAPPSNAATIVPCTKLLQALPERLGDLLPRVVHPKPDSLFVVAWGDPAVLVRCGVDRPADLKPGSSDFAPEVDGVSFLEKDVGDTNVYTSVDRAVYIELTFPKKSGSGELPVLAAAIAKALPPVCLPQALPGETPPPPNRLCTHRP
jgi:Protein of unknown function (DUF3515)